jgi:MYXO-CTERM domain-containing protein
VKQTGPVGLVAVTLAALVLRVAAKPGGSRWVASVLWSWAGFLAGVGVIVGLLALRGTLAEAWRAVFVFNTRYAGVEGWLRALRGWGRAVDALEPIQLALWFALLGLVGAFLGRRRARFPRSLAVGLLIWFLLEVLLALVGPSRSSRYWQATWPPILLLGASAFRYLQMSLRRLGRSYRGGFCLILATVVLVLLGPTWQHYSYGLAASYQEYTGKDRERDRLRTLAARLVELVPEQQPVYVLNYDSGVYVYSGRAAVSRFTYPRSHEQVAEILGTLEAGEAAAILVPPGRGRLPVDYMNDAAWARVRSVLEDYDLLGPRPEDGGYDIYLRRSP